MYVVHIKLIFFLHVKILQHRYISICNNKK